MQWQKANGTCQQNNKFGGGWRVTLPLNPACKAGASLFCHTPKVEIYFEMAGRRGAAPRTLSFGGSAAQAGARPVETTNELRITQMIPDSC
jgi:hypothetical protein